MNGGNNVVSNTIFGLNHQAVCLLREGRYRSAIAILEAVVGRITSQQHRDPRVIFSLQRWNIHDEDDDDDGNHEREHDAVRTSQRDNPNTPSSSSSSSEGTTTPPAAVVAGEDVSIVSVPIDRNTTSPMDPSTTLTNCMGDTNLFQPFESMFSTPYWNYDHGHLEAFRFTWAFLLYNLAFCYHHLHFHTINVIRNRSNQYTTTTTSSSSSTPTSTQPQPSTSQNRTRTRRRPQRNHLVTAILLYRAAMVAVDWVRVFDGCKPQDILLLKLAICNNMGHIYNIMGMEQEARDCLLKLRAMVILAPPQHRNAFVDRRVMSFFEVACIVLPEDIFNKAPAA